MGNTCGCGDKGDLEQEVRADPVSRTSSKIQILAEVGLFCKTHLIHHNFNHFEYNYAVLTIFIYFAGNSPFSWKNHSCKNFSQENSQSIRKR